MGMSYDLVLVVVKCSGNAKTIALFVHFKNGKCYAVWIISQLKNSKPGTLLNEAHIQRIIFFYNSTA